MVDILRHVPRSVFSDKENAIIHWALLSLGVKNVPSEHQMKDVNAFVQKLCGVQSIRHKGSLGHVYYTNDLAAILAQVRLFTFLSTMQTRAGPNDLE